MTHKTWMAGTRPAMMPFLTSGESVQPFTSTGPVPCGRSFSPMMPSRLATSV